MFDKNDHIIQPILFYWLCKQWLIRNKQLFLRKFQLFFHLCTHLVELSNIRIWRNHVTHKAPSTRHYKNGLEQYHDETQTLWLDSFWLSINQNLHTSHEPHSVLQQTKMEDIQK